MAQGRFRQDLYYRLNVVVITIPPLRDRIEDVPLLARHFCEQFHTAAGEIKRIAKDALGCLVDYDWPGNVRELENVIRRAVAMGQGDLITASDLPESFQTAPPTPAQTDGAAQFIEGDSLEAFEAAAIRNALSKCNGNRKRASSLLGIGEATLYRKLKKYHV